MKLYFIILALATSFAGASANGFSLIRALVEQNTQAFDWEYKGWEADAESMSEFLKIHMERRLHPTPARKRDDVFAFFMNINEQECDQADLVVDPTTWQDLELFVGKGQYKDRYLAQAVDRTFTEFGRVQLYALLSKPITDFWELRERQRLVKVLFEYDDLRTEIEDIFVEIARSENMLISMWSTDQLKRGTRERIMFKTPGLGCLNSSPTALFSKATFDHLFRGWETVMTATTVAALVGYGVCKAFHVEPSGAITRWVEEYKGTGDRWVTPVLWRFNTYDLSRAAIAGFAAWHCAAALPEQYQWLHDNIEFERSLHTVCRELSVSIAGLKKLATLLYDRCPYPIPYIEPQLRPLFYFFDLVEENKKVQELLDLLESSTFKHEYSFFQHRGHVIRAYTLFHELRHEFEDLIGAVGLLDAYLSCARLVREHVEKPVHYCFVQYSDEEQPSLQLERFWHPLVPVDKVVPSSLTLGFDKAPRNMVLTGPNAGGKSTVLKAAAFSLIMAQTVGIAPADSCVFTLFDSIATYLNIIDDLGSGSSLFKAEVERAHNLLLKIESLAQSKRKSITFFDEIFSGTTPLEGEATAFAMAKLLGTHTNSICAIATHFPLLTTLEEKTGNFTNYKVKVQTIESGAIKYSYTIEKGISDQHVAIDILASQGFSNKVINEAREQVALLSRMI